MLWGKKPKGIVNVGIKEIKKRKSQKTGLDLRSTKGV